MATINKYNFLRWSDGILSSSESAVKFNMTFNYEWKYVNGVLVGLEGWRTVTSGPYSKLPGVVPEDLWVGTFGAKGRFMSQENKYLYVGVSPNPNLTFQNALTISNGFKNSSGIYVPKEFEAGDYRLSLNVIEKTGALKLVVYRNQGNGSMENLQEIPITNLGVNTFDFNLTQSGTYVFMLHLFPKSNTEEADFQLEDFKLTKLITSAYTFEKDSIPAKYNAKSVDKSYPLFVPGEQTSFYINKLLNYTGNLSLSLVDANNGVTVVENVGTLNKLQFGGGYHLYSTFNNPNVPDGCYRLGIQDENNILILASNPIVVTRKNYLVFSKRFKYRHDDNIFGFMYKLLPNFHHEFRLPVLEVDCQTNFDIDQYKSVTTGKRRNYKNKSDRYRKYETYYYDSDMHEAASAMMEHEFIYLNDVRFTQKSGYKINTDVVSRVCKGEFEVYEDQYISDKNEEPTV